MHVSLWFSFLQHTFLIQFLFKTDEILSGAPSSSSTHSLFNSYSKLMKILSGAPLLLQYTFLIQFLFKIDEILSGAPSSSSTHSLFNSYSKLMKILSGAPLLLQYTFLIQFLFNIDGNPLWRPPPPPVHIPYSMISMNLAKKVCIDGGGGGGEHIYIYRYIYIYISVLHILYSTRTRFHHILHIIARYIIYIYIDILLHILHI